MWGLHSLSSGELNTVYRDWFLLAYLIGNSDNFFVKFLKLQKYSKNPLFQEQFHNSLPESEISFNV